MFNTALRIVNRVPDAEDILQDAFTDAFMKLRDFENRSTFGAWLKQIVVYKSLNFLKRQRTNLIDIESIGEAADEERDEDTVWYTVDLIREVMKDLPDGYRTVLSLHLFEGYEQDEVAEILKVAPSTVRTQYIRGKQKLLNLLKVRAANEQ
jgi:RNA polymerase sigma-70 factor (ECF subfamily)